MNHLLDGLANPIKTLDTQAYTVLDRKLSQKLKTYVKYYPHDNQESSTPLGIIHTIVSSAAPSNNPKTFHVSNLVQLGL